MENTNIEVVLDAALGRIAGRLAEAGHRVPEYNAPRITYYGASDWRVSFWICAEIVGESGRSLGEAVDALLNKIQEIWTPADALATIGLNPDGTIKDDERSDEREAA